MKFASILRGIAFATWGNFRSTIVARRFYTLSVVVGAIAVFFSWSFASSAFAARETVDPVAVWQRGPDGALAVFAFGLAPLLLPVLPIGVAVRVTHRDRETGYAETAYTRLLPRWATALGKFLGLFLAIAIPVLILDGVGLVVIRGVTAESPDAGFAAAFLGATLFLVALYLALILALSAFLSSGQSLWAAFLAWVGFNGLRSTGAVLMGHYFLIVILAREEFRAGGGDFASFTGMFETILAQAVPADLMFVYRPAMPDLGGLLAFNGAAMVGVVWMGFLLLVYLVLTSRYPLGR